jgi:hypothetical protein
MNGAGRRWRGKLIALGLLIAGAAGIAPASPAKADPETGSPTWTVVELPPLPGDEWAMALRFDAQGRILGSSERKLVRWDGSGQPTALPLPSGCTESTPWTMNDAGDVIGAASCTDGLRTMFWPAGGGVEPFTAPLDAHDLNDAGVVVGSAARQAARWLPGTGVVLLLDTGCQTSEAAAVTDTALVVGTCTIDGATHAVGWFGPYVFPLTASPNSRGIMATDSGIAMVTSDGQYTLVTAAGSAPVNSGGEGEEVIDINNYGLAVGRLGPRVDGHLVHAGLFAYGTAVRLDDLLPPDNPFPSGLGQAWGINDQGEIVGRTDLSAGPGPRAWLLRPPTRSG